MTFGTDVGFERKGERGSHVGGLPIRWCGGEGGPVVLFGVVVQVRVGGGRVRPAGSLLQEVSPPPGNLDFLPSDWSPCQSCYPLWREIDRTNTSSFGPMMAIFYHQ